MKNLSIFDTFLVVSKEQSMTKAAKQLGISQAAVSKQMKTLEEYLGFVLFETKKIPKSLNSDGKALERIIRSYLLTLERFKKERLASSSSLSGHLAIYSNDALGNYTINDVLTNFGCMYPNVSIDLQRINTKSEIDLAPEGRFYLLPDNDYIPGATTIKKFDSVPLGIAISQDVPLAHKSIIKECDIRHLRLITPNNLLLNAELVEWLNHKKPNVLCDDWGVTQSILSKGGGIAIVPINVQNDETLKTFNIIPLYPLISIGFKLVYKGTDEMNLTEKTFVKFLSIN